MCHDDESEDTSSTSPTPSSSSSTRVRVDTGTSDLQRRAFLVLSDPNVIWISSNKLQYRGYPLAVTHSPATKQRDGTKRSNLELSSAYRQLEPIAIPENLPVSAHACTLIQILRLPECRPVATVGYLRTAYEAFEGGWTQGIASRCSCNNGHESCRQAGRSHSRRRLRPDRHPLWTVQRQ